jgi:hypothetical protein
MKPRQTCTPCATGHAAWARNAAVALALLAGACAACRADASVRTAAAGSGALSASAHLDFIVTVLPSLALSSLSTGVRVQSNLSALSVQRSALGAADGQPPSATLTLPYTHRGVDASVPAPSAAGTDVLTVASP